MMKPTPTDDAERNPVELFLERGYLLIDTGPSAALIAQLLDALEQDDQDAPHLPLNQPGSN
ncbi:MAG: hypothetical protein O2782_13395 [bacterium]|nr:hypothetical protein [bacterium]